MLLKGQDRSSTLEACLNAATDYQLGEAEAIAIVEQQIAAIAENWAEVCRLADVSPVDRALFASRQFLNGYCLSGIEDRHVGLRDVFMQAVSQIQA